ncbi:3'(2'),5'-bisphosphate nucleotidase [Planctomicrobium sp. SH668]|uniref:3'(2'),5'-bisphosphate nucleotidase n=1 Tax=Planctomicrobium sp. SH668 TaxID=3448126 RepID=UPI003F5B24D6
MLKNYEQELNVAIHAVLTASRICRAVQRRITDESLSKKDASPVTIADYASQAVICKEIREAFPDEFIVGEEDAADLRLEENRTFKDQALAEIQAVGIPCTDGEMLSWIDSGNHDGTSERYWTLDPIDGTKGFLRKEQFAISLALLVNHQIHVAALACPNLSAAGGTGVLFYAVRGGGAWMVPIDAPESQPVAVKVSLTSDSKLARMCESVESGHSAHDQSALILQSLAITAEPVRMDSQAKYGAVARGEADIYLRLPTRVGYAEKIWDHAGGVLVVEEAGGRVTDIDGKPLDFAVGSTLKNNRGVVVTNGGLHEAVLAAIRSISSQS